MPSEGPTVQEEGFRSSLFGFDKSDVLSYMNALAGEAKQQEQEYQKKIETLEQQNAALKATRGDVAAAPVDDTLKQRLSELTTEAARARQEQLAAQEAQKTSARQLDAFRTQCEDRDRAIELLRRKILEQQSQIKEKSQKLNDSVKEIEQMRAKTALATADSVETKAEEPRTLENQPEQSEPTHQSEWAQWNELPVSANGEGQPVQGLAAAPSAPDREAAPKAEEPAPAFAAAPPEPTKCTSAGMLPDEQRRDLARAQYEMYRIQARKVLEDARVRAQNAQKQMEHEASHQKYRMVENARSLAAGAVLLQERLQLADDKLNQAAMELQNATAGVHRALEETFTDLEGLGLNLRDYGESNPELRRPCPETLRSQPLAADKAEQPAGAAPMSAGSKAPEEPLRTPEFRPAPQRVRVRPVQYRPRGAADAWYNTGVRRRLRHNERVDHTSDAVLQNLNEAIGRLGDNS